MCKMDRKQLNNVCTLCGNKAFEWIQIVHVFCHARPSSLHFRRWSEYEYTSFIEFGSIHTHRAIRIYKLLQHLHVSYEVYDSQIYSRSNAFRFFSFRCHRALIFSSFYGVYFIQRIHMLLSPTLWNIHDPLNGTFVNA